MSLTISLKTSRWPVSVIIQPHNHSSTLFPFHYYCTWKRFWHRDWPRGGGTAVGHEHGPCCWAQWSNWVWAESWDVWKELWGNQMASNLLILSQALISSVDPPSPRWLLLWMRRRSTRCPSAVSVVTVLVTEETRNPEQSPYLRWVFMPPFHTCRVLPWRLNKISHVTRGAHSRSQMTYIYY